MGEYKKILLFKYCIKELNFSDDKKKKYPDHYSECVNITIDALNFFEDDNPTNQEMFECITNRIKAHFGIY